MRVLRVIIIRSFPHIWTLHSQTHRVLARSRSKPCIWRQDISGLHPSPSRRHFEGLELQWPNPGSYQVSFNSIYCHWCAFQVLSGIVFFTEMIGLIKPLIEDKVKLYVAFWVNRIHLWADFPFPLSFFSDFQHTCRILVQEAPESWCPCCRAPDSASRLSTTCMLSINNSMYVFILKIFRRLC